MRGIILCGGQSLRMGTDKGLISDESKTWAQNAYAKIASLHFPVSVSVNSLQKEAYAAIFSETDLITDNPLLPLKGPLLGVLSSHTQFPAEDLMVLACDMPLMEASIVKELYSIYKDNRSFDAYIFTNDGEPEPLFAIYSANALSAILSMLQTGKLLKHSMKFMLDHLKVFSTAASNEQKQYFRNFNAHAQLNGQ
jgi:molybdenum cofactor guanylyltransferase